MKPGNKNAAHAVKPDTHLHMRCVSTDKQLWSEAADGDLSPWVVATLNVSAQVDLFNAACPVGSQFLFGDRTVVTRSEAYVAGGNPVVKIKGRQAGVNILELIA